MTWLRLAVVSLTIVGATACRGNNPEVAYAYTVPTGGDADRGKALILQFDCGSCHTIPGVRGARGLVGPPLLWFARRTFIAGLLVIGIVPHRSAATYPAADIKAPEGTRIIRVLSNSWRSSLDQKYAQRIERNCRSQYSSKGRLAGN